MKNKLAKILVLLTVVVVFVATMALSASAVAVTGVSGVEDGHTSFVGYWNFEAGKEYILVIDTKNIVTRAKQTM